MKYQIGDFELDTQNRVLTNGEQSKNIRPKTLALMLYLAERPHQIISKQELLDSVWDDVNVDDGVIFQSIREVRQLFDNPNIIQNYPRKGYEFTAEITPLVAVQVSKPVNTNIVILVSLVVLVISVLFGFWHYFKDDELAYEQRIVVLPIKNYIDYGEYEWLYLGGMEQLISELKGLPSSTLVHQGNYTPRLMHMAGIEREYSSTDVAKLFKVSGASLIVETEVHGNAADYKFVYKFHISNDIKQGVVLATSINSGLRELATKLAEFISQPLTLHDIRPTKEFSDALFAEAMISYENDWQTSISFFESYLALNPQSVIAAMYLSKLYLWEARLDDALDVLVKADKYVTADVSQQAELSLIKGRIATKQLNWPLAHQYFNKAESLLAQGNFWLLKANVAEERGLAFMAQGELTQAHRAFKESLSYYLIVESPIGINTSKLHLAAVLTGLGNTARAKQFYLQAKQSIETNNIAFLDTMLLNYKEKLEVDK